MTTIATVNLTEAGRTFSLGENTQMAVAAATRAENAEAGAIAAKDAAIALLDSKFGLPCVSINFLSDSSVNSTSGVSYDDAMAPLTFARASQAWDVSGGVLTSFASGAPALTAEGLAIRPARTQLLEYGQKFDESSAWTIAGIGTPANGGTGPLGVNDYDITLNAGSGAKSIRQTEAVVSGRTYTLAFTIDPNSQNDFVVSLGGTPFATGGSPLIYFNMASKTATLSGGAVERFDVIDFGNGIRQGWISKTAASSGTATGWLYSSSGVTTSWTAVGTENFTLISADLYEGEVPVPPILTPGITDGVRAADVVYMDFPADSCSFGARFVSDSSRAPSGYRLFRGTATDNISVRQSAGKLVLRTMVAGATVTELTGVDVSGDDAIAVVYSKTTRAIQWAVNGEAQPSGVGGPTTGLDRFYLGSDASGGNQFNGKIAWAEIALGLTNKLLSATGGTDPGGGVPATVAATEMLFEANADRVSVYRRQYGDVWLGKDINRVATTTYQGVDYADGWWRGATRECVLSGGVMTTVKTRELAGAEDDSMGASDRASPNAFWAIGAHGDHLKGKASRFLRDGAVFVPAVFDAGLHPLQRLDVRVEADAWHPDRVELCANKSHDLFFLPDRTEYEPEWRWLVAMEIDPGSYLHGMRESQTHELPVSGGLYNQGALWLDTAWTEESPFAGQSILPGAGSPVTTEGKIIRLTGPDRWWCEFEVKAGPFDRIFVKRSIADSTNGKIYPALGAPGTNLQTQIGARWFARSIYREGVLRP